MAFIGGQEPAQGDYFPLRGIRGDHHRNNSLFSPSPPRTPGSAALSPSADPLASAGLSEPLRSARSTDPLFDRAGSYQHSDAGLSHADDDKAGSHFSSHGGAQIHWKAGSIDKLCVLLAALFPMVVSGYVLSQSVKDVRSTGPLLEYVTNDRATVQIVVSIVAAMLAALNVFVVTMLLRLATRIYLLRRALSLNWIKFLGACAMSRWGDGLPLTFLVAGWVVVVIYAGPNVLWTGALTPVGSNATVSLPGMLRIPQYSVGSNDTWSKNGFASREQCETVINKHGLFGNCATAVLQSNLLTRASGASSNQTAQHAKDDYSHYAYVGRSYGVGASVGIADENLSAGRNGTSLLSYNYTEPGYVTDVQCSFNKSSNYQFLTQSEDDELPEGVPIIYSAQGWAPNSDPTGPEDHFAVVGFGTDDLAVITGKHGEGRDMIVMVAGKNYPLLNGTQCEITFKPTMFTVGVDAVRGLIYVNPAADPAPTFDPTGGLAITLVEQMNTLGMISTSLYTSTVGDALMANVNATSAVAFSDAQFAALGESFAVMFDDLLAFIAASQFFVPFDGAGDSSQADVVMTVEAVSLGDLRYVAATFAMCALLVVAALVEAARTRGWRALPYWDLTDSTCLILAGAVAGPDLLGKMPRSASSDNPQGFWSGDGEENLGGAQVRIGHKVVHEGFGEPLAAVSLWTQDARDVDALIH